MAKLRQPVVTSETFSEYMAMGPDEQDNIKDVGYYVFGHYLNGVRKRVNLPYVDAIVLDLDHCDTDWDFDLPMAFDGIQFALHSTHKHSPNAPRLRQIFPLTRRVTPDEYEPIARMLATKYDIEVYDKTTFQFSRVMHWPSHAVDGEYICEEYPGAWLDPQKILAEYQDWADVQQWPRHADVNNVRAPHSKAPDPCEKPGWVGAFCRTYPISAAIEQFLPEVYSWTGDTRLTYNAGSTTDGAEVYEDKFLYSHHESDPCSQRLVNSFDLVRLHLHGHLDDKEPDDTPISKLPSHTAMAYMLDNDPEFLDVKIELARDTAQRGQSEFDDITDEDDDTGLPPELPAVQGGYLGGATVATRHGVTVPRAAMTNRVPPKGWEASLVVDQHGKFMKTLTNVVTIMKYDPTWGFNVRFNKFAQSHVVTRTLPHHVVIGDHHLVNGDLFTDRDVSQIKLYLEKQYNLTNIAVDMIWHAVEIVGTEHAFHPVLNYFEKLPVWDGTPRLDTLLIDYLGAPDTPLVRAVTRKTLCGAINRIKFPGSKWDYLLILEGLQGVRKGLFLRTLAKNDSWFAEGIGRDLGDKATENMMSKWLIELPEGEGMMASNKLSVDDIKAFISKQTDRMRPKYTRVAQDFPRQCVFIATTNQYEYLSDGTGNRRFWPVRCGIKGQVDIDRLEQEIDQVWAEAIYRWNQGEKLWLTGNLEAELEVQHDERMKDDGLAGKIQAWLEEPIQHEFESSTGEDEYRDITCVRQIWVECMGEPEGRINRAQTEHVVSALKKIPGWDWRPGTVRKFTGYGRQKAFIKLDTAEDGEA